MVMVVVVIHKLVQNRITPHKKLLFGAKLNLMAHYDRNNSVQRKKKEHIGTCFQIEIFITKFKVARKQAKATSSKFHFVQSDTKRPREPFGQRYDHNGEK